MRVVKYQVHNVLGVKHIDFNLEGRHLFLVGGVNENGKTSAINALLMALCGRRNMEYPEVALRRGEDKGWVKVQLSGDDEMHDSVGFTAELFLRRKASGEVIEEFRLLDSTGEEAPTPRHLLEELFKFKGFDPLAFERMSKADQRQTLVKLAGLDFDDKRKLQKDLYDKRSVVNSEGKRFCCIVPANEKASRRSG